MNVAATFLLLAHRQEATIGDAVDAALAQVGEPLDILLSDDASPDGTYAIMAAKAAAYRGPHRVRARQSKLNRGLIGHIAEAVEEAEGQLIIVAAGDDLSEPDRARLLIEAWDRGGRPSAYLYSDVQPIGGDGRPVSFDGESVAPGPFTLQSLAEGSVGALGAGSAFTRDLLARPGPIDRAVVHEDRVLPFRALLLGGKVMFVDRPLVRYRVDGGMSRQRPQGLRDYLTRHAQAYLPRIIPDALQRLADAEVGGAPREVIATCRATLAYQEAKLAMSDGRDILAKLIAGVRAGAPALRLVWHSSKFLVARAANPPVSETTRP